MTVLANKPALQAGSFRINAGYDSVPAVIGPICRSLRDLELVYSTVLATEPWLREHQLIPLPWRQQESDIARSRNRAGKLKIGFMLSDGIAEPHPPIRNAIIRLRQLLSRDQSFEVMEFGVSSSHFMTCADGEQSRMSTSAEVIWQ